MHAKKSVDEYCPNIAAVYFDKDQTELKAFQFIFPHTKGQLCYWHAVQYLESGLPQSLCLPSNITKLLDETIEWKDVMA